MNKKIIGLLFCALIVGSVFILPVFAGNFGLDATANKIGGYDTTKSGEEALVGTIHRVVDIFLSMLGVMFVGIMIYAGLRWMTARGKEEFIEKAKVAMESAILGLIIVIVSYGLSTFIFSKLVG